MREFMRVLKKCALFADVAEENIGSMLECLGATVARYKKDDLRRRQAGVDASSSTGASTSCGRFWGYRTTSPRWSPATCSPRRFPAPSEALPISAVAQADTAVLLVDYGRVIVTCPTACAFHQQPIKNMVRFSRRKHHVHAENPAHHAQTTRMAVSISPSGGARGADRFDIPSTGGACRLPLRRARPSRPP